jgi:predicted acetyltransferase
METMPSKKIRIFRSKEKILFILKEYEKSNLRIKAFCLKNNIASASFHNWKKRYSSRSVKPAKPTGFVALQIEPPVSESGLFAAVKEIKIYQPVAAAYLK